MAHFKTTGMKKAILLTLFAIVSFFSNGQRAYEFSFNPFIRFDDTLSIKYIQIDTTLSNNIWQIGEPQKIIFNSAFSNPNALLTDTVNAYPVNNYSAFYMTFVVSEGYMIFDFQHKFDTDTSTDGGKIELSIDGRTSWHNITDDAYWAALGYNFFGTTNIYSVNDTVSVFNEPGFSGNSNGWLHSYLVFEWQQAFVLPDTFELRFVFSSDSIDHGKEGWMIDQIQIIANHTGISENRLNDLSIFPNPSEGIVNIGNIQHQIRQVKVFDCFGRNVFLNSDFSNTRIDLSQLADGIYYICIVTDESEFGRKVVLRK